MRLSEFDYKLPPELIAQTPVRKRDTSRLLVLHRDTGQIEHKRFYNLPEYIQPSDILVMNDTRVSALRLIGSKPTGAKVEVLLLREVGPNLWEALVKPGRRVPPGAKLLFGEENLSAHVVARTEHGGRILYFGDSSTSRYTIRRLGTTPLPPYVHTELSNPNRYQTVYSTQPGSAAAPTAGLHFTKQLIAQLKAKGVNIVFITLDIGIATFRPVQTQNIEDHVMHEERISVSQEAVDAINSAEGRIIAIGTTTVRALETAAIAPRTIVSSQGPTSLFIKPGYQFKIVDALVTNFHMPKSTLLMLVAAFASRDAIIGAYEEAIRLRYRFLSFGDAMLIL